MQVSPIYSEIILKHSSYEKPQQDRLFFEALYQTLILLLDEAFARLQKRAEIEQEIGNMFRSKHFNLYKRKNQPPRCGAACGSVAVFEQTLGADAACEQVWGWDACLLRDSLTALPTHPHVACALLPAGQWTA